MHCLENILLHAMELLNTCACTIIELRKDADCDAVIISGLNASNEALSAENAVLRMENSELRGENSQLPGLHTEIAALRFETHNHYTAKGGIAVCSCVSCNAHREKLRAACACSFCAPDTASVARRAGL